MYLNKLFDVEGKVALVTGGGSCIGNMAVSALAQAGCKVYVVSRRLDSCEAIAQEVRDAGGKGEVIGMKADLSTEEGTASLVQAFAEREEKLDILVNHAAMTWSSPFEDFPRQKWDDVFRVNVTSVADLTRRLLPLLKKAGTADDPARVINIGSSVGTRAISNKSYSYGTSKAAMHHLTRILANELARSHITVNAIALGAFPSRMLSSLVDKKERVRVVEEYIPLYRFGMEEDLAGVLLMLSSQAGSYVTGAILPLDGGISALP